MKRNGFTLAELLAVIVILGIITLIAIPTTFAVSHRIKIKLYCTKMETLRKAAEQYANDHFDEVNLGMVNKVTVRNLVDYDYTKKDKDATGNVYIIDPRDSETSLDDITFALKINNSRPKVTFEQESYYYLCGDDKLKDTKAPSCIYKGESTTWTNQDRSITISCYDAGSGCKTKDEVKTYTTTTKNDKINLTIRDWVGKTTKCDRNLDVYVDKTKPSYEITGEATGSSDWSNRRIITVKCIDNDSGCKTENIKFEYGIGASDNSKRNVNIDTISFTLEDNAGNKKTYTKEVKVYTDVDNPTCSYSGESTTWSHEGRTVQIVCNDNRSGCKVASKSITVSNSIATHQLNFIAEDRAGNQTDCTKDLNIYVDTEKPNVSIKNITNNVAASQTVTLSMSDNIEVKEYYYGTTNPSSNNVTWTKYTTNNISQTVSNNGTYYLAARDAAGNMAVTSKTFYKTTLNGNNGTVSPSTVITLSGNTFSIPNASRNYYTFDGWYTAATGGTKQATSYKPTSNTTLYAHFTPVSYKITYKTNNSNCPNGSNGNPANYTVETANFTLKNPTCTGYTFNGWSGTGLSGSANTSVTVSKGSTGDRTYTANWTINTYYLDLNGLLDGTSSGSIANFGTADVYINGTLVANDTTDYYTKHEYGTSYEIKDIKAAAGRTYNGVSSGSAKGTIGAGNVAVQLKYTTTTYTISYNLNGGSASNNTSYTVDTASFTLNNPTKAGHTFAGWTGSNGSTPQTTVTINKGSTGNKSYTASWNLTTPPSTPTSLKIFNPRLNYNQTATYSLNVSGSTGSYGTIQYQVKINGSWVNTDGSGNYSGSITRGNSYVIEARACYAGTNQCSGSASKTFQMDPVHLYIAQLIYARHTRSYTNDYNTAGDYIDEINHNYNRYVQVYGSNMAKLAHGVLVTNESTLSFYPASGSATDTVKKLYRGILGRDTGSGDQGGIDLLSSYISKDRRMEKLDGSVRTGECINQGVSYTIMFMTNSYEAQTQIYSYWGFGTGNNTSDWDQVQNCVKNDNCSYYSSDRCYTRQITNPF